jgi:hypothetical protein
MSNHSRRAILAGIAASPALAAPALALSVVGPDPIFALIDRHRTALAAHLAASEAQGDLEVRLVDERLTEAGSPEECSDRWYGAIKAANRDPRYVDAKAVCDKTSAAEVAAAWALVAEPPATIAGAAALAGYVPEYESVLSLPDDPDEWLRALLASVHSALSGGAVS